MKNTKNTKNPMAFEITKHIADLSAKNGWIKQLNKVKWGDNPEKLEIRLWHYSEGSDIPDNVGKGITLTEDELIKLSKVVLEEFGTQPD